MDIRNTVREMPFYDTHCHIGCNEALGRNGGTFLCDCVRGLDAVPMDLWALLLSVMAPESLLKAVDYARQMLHTTAHQWYG